MYCTGIRLRSLLRKRGGRKCDASCEHAYIHPLVTPTQHALVVGNRACRSLRTLVNGACVLLVPCIVGHAHTAPISVLVGCACRLLGGRCCHWLLLLSCVPHGLQVHLSCMMLHALAGMLADGTHALPSTLWACRLSSCTCLDGTRLTGGSSKAVMGAAQPAWGLHCAACSVASQPVPHAQLEALQPEVLSR